MQEAALEPSSDWHSAAVSQALPPLGSDRRERATGIPVRVASV